MIKDIQRPNWDELPAKVADLTPKQLFNLLRVASKYEWQESSIFEAAGWHGDIYKALAGMFSAPGDQEHANADTVYTQQVNTAYTGSHKA